MMEQVPGAYLNVGNGDGCPPHHPEYDFNDAAIPFGAGLYARWWSGDCRRASEPLPRSTRRHGRTFAAPRIRQEMETIAGSLKPDGKSDSCAQLWASRYRNRR